jgi:hypothetical protein
MNIDRLIEHIRFCRKPFLDFIRNFTSQAILLSFAMIVATKIDLFKFDFNLDNLLTTTIFYLLIICFLYSVYANSTLFIKDCFPALFEWQAEQIKLLKVEGVKWYRRFDRMIVVSVKQGKVLTIFGYMAAIFFVEVAIAIVFVMSYNAATKMWNDNHRAVISKGAQNKKDKQLENASTSASMKEEGGQKSISAIKKSGATAQIRVERNGVGPR